jgi:ribonuclease BN (tRNA processing enzyme)
VAGCLIILGSGTPLPNPARSGPAYALVFGDRTFLFDAGAGVMRRAAAAGLPIDGFTHVFLTHLHTDHTLGLPDAIFTSWTMGRRTAMPVTGPPGTQAMVTHLMAAWAEDVKVRTEGLEHGQRDGERVLVHESSGGVVYDSAGLVIRAVPVPHGTWPVAFAYVIQLPTRRLVLSGDTRYSPALMEAARGADVLVHEVYPESRLAPEQRPGGEDWPAYMRAFHTSDRELAQVATQAGVKHLVLSHLLLGGPVEDLVAAIRRFGFAGRVSVAADLETY